MQWQWINWCSQYKWLLIIIIILIILIIKQLVSEHSKISQNYFRCCQNIKWSIPSTLPSVCVDHQCKIHLCPVSSELQPAAMCFYLPGSVSHCTRTKCLDKAGYHSDTAEARNAVQLLQALRSLRNCGNTVWDDDQIFFKITLLKSQLIYPSQIICHQENIIVT